jgi:hypothetical protein
MRRTSGRRKGSSSGEKGKTVAVFMPEDLYARLVAFAEEDCRSLPNAIRQAVFCALDGVPLTVKGAVQQWGCVPAVRYGKIIPFPKKA